MSQQYGVIEHVRPPRCPRSGEEADPRSVSVLHQAPQATCPECKKELWLNKVAGPELFFIYHFPEHIGKT